jgi:hypothetical protein
MLSSLYEAPTYMEQSTETQTVAREAIRQISLLQDLYKSTGVSTICYIKDVLNALNRDELIAVCAHMKEFGITDAILSGRVTRKARKLDDEANAVVYGKGATDAEPGR